MKSSAYQALIPAAITILLATFAGSSHAADPAASQNGIVVAPMEAQKFEAPADEPAPTPTPLADAIPVQPAANAPSTQQKTLAQIEAQRKAEAERKRMNELSQAFGQTLANLLTGSAVSEDQDMSENPVGSISSSGVPSSYHQDLSGSPMNNFGTLSVNDKLVPSSECNTETGLPVSTDEDFIDRKVEQLHRNPDVCKAKPNPPGDRLTCMACNLYFEARSESLKGQIAAGQTVMTRLFSNYATDKSTVCSIIWEKAQYSWTLQSVLPARQRVMMDKKALKQVMTAATQALCRGASGYSNYYAWNTVYPKWAKSGTCASTLVTLGAHNFCSINVKEKRPRTEVLMAERLTDPARSTASEGGAVNETNSAD